MSLIRRADRLAQDHTEKAIDTIVEIMEDGFAENRDRLRAAEAILDRGHGKPLTASISLPANKEQLRQLAAMADEDLLAVVNSRELPRLSQAEFDVSADPLLD